MASVCRSYEVNLELQNKSFLVDSSYSLYVTVTEMKVGSDGERNRGKSTPFSILSDTDQ